jgi:hypothetical protein
MGAGVGGLGGGGLGDGFTIFGTGGAAQQRWQTRIRGGAEKFQRFAGAGMALSGLMNRDLTTTALGLGMTLKGPIGTAAAAAAAAYSAYTMVADVVEQQRDKRRARRERRVQRHRAMQTIERGGFKNARVAEQRLKERMEETLRLDEKGIPVDAEKRAEYEKLAKDIGPYEALQAMITQYVEKAQQQWARVKPAQRQIETMMERGLVVEAQRMAKQVQAVIEERYDEGLKKSELLNLVAIAKRTHGVAVNPVAAYERQEAKRTSKRHRMRWQMYLASSRTGD